MRHGRYIPSAFVPAWWLPGPHAQTLWSNLFRRLPQIELTRERLELPDGDFLDLDWHGCAGRGLVVILHGLEGSSGSHYARGLMHALGRCDLASVVLHFRGCSGEPNRLVRGYHGGDTADFAYLLRLLRARHPGLPLAAVGYSLGGNVLLNWLGRNGAAAGLNVAAAVSVPFDLAAAARHLERRGGRLYQRVLVRRMCRSMARKRRAGLFELPIDLERLRTFYEFDDRITAPLHGYAGADDYYARASCRQHLAGIEVPTLILHSRDDPFLPAHAIPQPAELGPAVEFELTARGGHVGFIAGRWPGRAVYYLEQRIAHYFHARLSPEENTPASDCRWLSQRSGAWTLKPASCAVTSSQGETSSPARRRKDARHKSPM